MALELKLALDAIKLRYQEDTVCRLGLVNRGSAPVSVSFPNLLNLQALRLRMIDVKTGVEILHTPPADARQRIMPPHEQSFPPGATRSFEAILHQFPPVPGPGTYEVSAVLLYNNQTDQAESPPVRLEVRPTTPRNLFYLGGRCVWVNVNAEPPEILYNDVDVKPGGGLAFLRPIGPASLRAEPLVSGGPQPWVAWIQDAQLKFAQVDRTKVASFPLGSPRDVVVAPLHADGALIYRASGELEALKLAPEKATSHARAPFPGPRPLWISTFHGGQFKDLVLAVQADGDKIVLRTSAWPGSPRPAAVRTLGEWPGDLMGIGASATEEAVDGSLFVRRSTWQRIAFRIDVRGGFSSTSSPVPEPGPYDRFESAPRVRQSGPEACAALLKTLGGAWWIYDGKSVSPLPAELSRTPYPLDVDFMKGSPVLVAGFKDLGLHLRMADGRPLPPPPPSD